MADYEHIFQEVEHIACESVSCVTNCKISESDMYLAKTKFTSCVSMARQLAFLFMHDHYGISYRHIAEHAKMTIGAIMKCVGKARIYRISDSTYSRAYKLMNERL